MMTATTTTCSKRSTVPSCNSSLSSSQRMRLLLMGTETSSFDHLPSRMLNEKDGWARLFVLAALNLLVLDLSMTVMRHYRRPTNIGSLCWTNSPSVHDVKQHLSHHALADSPKNNENNQITISLYPHLLLGAYGLIRVAITYSKMATDVL
uniref:Uncharacterized protein n=1 Tax=Grammatophora oceanica TaxID=210454 RepID=A0A7S1UQ27_9STRA|mmetsp:Transcript_12865/g.19004  ORF Transcript_12865/g.19004 Transcript_12865/m.19004 type:complete len:150 (+) Transcript_12865:993-1442(+)